MPVMIELSPPQKKSIYLISCLSAIKGGHVEEKIKISPPYLTKYFIDLYHGEFICLSLILKMTRDANFSPTEEKITGCV